MKKLILIALAILTFASCKINDDADIRLLQVTNFETHGVTLSKARISVSAEIYSSANRRFSISDAELALNNGSGRELLRAKLTDGITIRKKRVTEITIPLDIKYDMPGAMLVMSEGSIDKILESDITVSGYLKFKKSIIGHKYEIDNMPLKEFMEFTGIDDIF
ncbi:MAG: hypothetical protein LUF90_05445 [Rikenellaceae bacterium]|nr:hypothetical protein [Rikenellaceae bacterium]